MRKILFLIIVLVFSNLAIKSQTSYSLLFRDNLNQSAIAMVETGNHKIVAVGTERLGAGYYPPTFKGKIWQFSSSTDTLSKTFAYGDTACTFGKVFETEQQELVIFGCAVFPPAYDKFIMLTIRMDQSLNELEHRIYQLEDWNYFGLDCVKKFGNCYYGFGSVYQRDTLPHHRCIVKFNADLSIAKYRIFTDENIGSNMVEDALLSSDSSQLIIFSESGMHVYDTAFNRIRQKKFPYRFKPGSYDFDVLYDAQKTAQWITDSTFLLSCRNTQTSMGQTVVYGRLGISEMDTSLAIAPLTYIGTADTAKYPAFEKAFDFITPDSIFITGTHLPSFTFWPRRPSWIIAGRLNRDLELQELHYYGGDAHYKVMSIVCTSDGGFVVAARRYDYRIQNYEWDVMFLKFNSKGEIVNNLPQEVCPESVFGLYPNPASERFTITLVVPQAELFLLSLQGQQVHRQTIYQGDTPISCTHLPAGVYVCKVTANNKVFTKKIVIN